MMVKCPFPLFLIVWPSVVCNFGDASNPEVNPPCGPIVGKEMKLSNGRKIAAFQGIPYAKPPINELRFKSPQPKDPWTKPLKAQKDSARCIQPLLPNQSEDCLYLSIYTPTVKPSKPLAVLAYFYGGIFNFGGTQDYGPDFLLQDTDIIFIIINSRGNLFGYLSFGDDVVTGNMGLKDCRLALQWIQENVHSFGGDPSKVTLWGLSSGAVIAHSFMTYASDQGLFRAGITNSGATLAGFGFKSPTEVTKMKYSIAQHSKCPEDSEGLLKCLQGKSAVEILTLYELNYHFVPVDGIEKFIPLIGPVMEPDCVADRFTTSNPWDTRVSVPWLGGVTSKEALLFVFPAINDITGIAFRILEKKFDTWFPLLMNYQHSVANGTGVVQAAREYYLKGKPISKKTLSQIVDLLSDAFFVYGQYEATKRSNTSQSFFYLLDYKGKYQMAPVLPSGRVGKWLNFQLLSDAFFVYGQYEATKRSNTSQSFFYLLDYKGKYQMAPVLPSGRVGAGHADELYFFFRQPGIPFKLPRFDTKEDIQMSRTLVKMWTNFAINLNPTPDDSLDIEWKPFSNDGTYLHFKQDGMTVENQFRNEQMAFWSSQPYPLRNDGDFRDVPCEGYGKDYIFNTSVDD